MREATRRNSQIEIGLGIKDLNGRRVIRLSTTDSVGVPGKLISRGDNSKMMARWHVHGCDGKLVALPDGGHRCRTAQRRWC